MSDQTATVVLEGPRGEERRIDNVESVVTNEDGSIGVETADSADIETVGWDWTIRDVYVSWGPVDVGENVTYTDDGQIRRGKVTSIGDDKVVVEQVPDGRDMEISRDNIIPV